jgi:RNase H-like domain found in reverse transcriptase
MNWPIPTNITELRAMFGTFSYYRRFVHDFAHRTTQMRKLLQKDTTFKWTNEHTKEMEDLKNALCSKPILAHHDFSEEAEPFVVYVDSSKTGIGAVLMQKQVICHNWENREEEIVIFYAPKALSVSEQHYGAYKKELLGIVYAVNHFRYYLLGKKFIICTDHKALEWLINTRSPNTPNLLYRWQDILSEFDFEIRYVAGRKMKHADGISRKAFSERDSGTIGPLPDYELAKECTEDEFWIPKIKTKEVNALDRPRQQTRPPQRFPT